MSAVLIAQLNHALTGKHGLFEKHRWFVKNTAHPVNQIVLTRLHKGHRSIMPLLNGNAVGYVIFGTEGGESKVFFTYKLYVQPKNKKPLKPSISGAFICMAER